MRLVVPDPPLSDGVVTLRPWEERDAPAIAAACRDEEIARWLDQVPQPYTRADARDYVAATLRSWRDGTAGSFAITDVSSGAVLGSVTLHWVDIDQAVAEVGYWVARDRRRRGIASRAVRLVARWGFEQCGLERLQLRADLLNLPSRRVAEKAGFREEGVLRSVRFSPRQRRRVDFVMYSLLPGELAEFTDS
jgi:RimJ/RimL family protein N-acetyltransferase